MTEIYDADTNKRKPLKQSDWEEKLTGIIIEEWDKGRQHVSKLNTMYEDLYLMLRGERPEKNYDWQSNLTLRKAFQVVWTAISYMSQKIFGASPVIGIQGFDDKGCWQREKLLEVWMAQDKYFLVVVLGLLRLLLNGVVIIKKGWHQVLVTREMEEEITMPVWDEKGSLSHQVGVTRRVTDAIPLEDRPDDVVINNKDIVTDWMLKPGQSITEGRFIIHREVLDLGTLYASRINYINLDDVSHGTLQETSEAQDSSRTRQEDHMADPPESSIYSEAEIFERQGIFPVKVGKDGKLTPLFDKKEIYKKGTEWRHMIVAVASKTRPVLIRWEENPYKEMTYIAGQMYLDSERWEGMGIVEPAKDVFVAMDDNINAMFDEIWKNLMPPTIFNKFALVEWDTIQHAPAQKWMVGGKPEDAVMFPRQTDITRDAWQKHLLLDGEGQLITSVTPPTQGMDKSKTATQGMLNAQFSTAKLDFLTKMIEVTWLVPSAQMTMRFAQKFAHPLTFIAILGESFKFDKFYEEYKFIPAASSVMLPEQKEREIQEDIQLIQTLMPMMQANPGIAKMINQLYANILRNRDKPKMAAMLDEDWFEPQSEGGQMQMMNQGLGIGPGAPSNEQGIAMSGLERSTRQNIFQPRGM